MKYYFETLYWTNTEQWFWQVTISCSASNSYWTSRPMDLAVATELEAQQEIYRQITALIKALGIEEANVNGRTISPKR